MTVTVQLARLMPSVTVITAVPGLTALTYPSLLMAAISVFEELHMSSPGASSTVR